MDEGLWAEIRRLYHRDGLSMRKIAVRLGINRRTVSRAIREERPSNPTRYRRESKLTPYKGFINNLLEEYPEISATRIFEEVCNAGYKGSFTILKDYMREICCRAKEAFLKIETLPGEQAQVDWADCGKIQVEGITRRVYCFAMVLGWSRYLYFEFSLSCRTEDFIQAHINAFNFFGGVPCKILYDNLKSVVLHRIGNHIKFNPRFMDFVGIYLFSPIVARLYRGSDKGKVESSIKYIKGNFLNGRTFRDYDDLVVQGISWRNNTANTRIHGTTRERPIDRFQLEKAKLNSLPDKPYRVFTIISCRVNPNFRVRFDTNSYTVPPRYVGRTLTLKTAKEEISIYYREKLIATHKRTYAKNKDIEDPRHMKELLKHKKRAIHSKIVDEFKSLSKEAEEKNLSYTEYLEEVIQEEVNSKIGDAIQRRIKTAKFPIIKTIDSFDFNWSKSINRKQITRFMELDFVQRKENIIIAGPPGVGKTHLATAIAYQACQQRIPTIFTTAIDIVNHLYAGMADNTFLKKLKSYIRPKLLVIDELGYLPLDKKGADLLFQIIDKRYEQGSIILTTNLAFKNWGKIFGDNSTATAVIDRLVHHSEAVIIKGDSYRLKNRKEKELWE